MVKNYTTIKERLRQLAKDKNISYEKLYQIIGMTDGSFKGTAIKRSLNSDAIVKFYTEYPDVNLEWLITGKEEKTQEKEKTAMSEPSKNYCISYKERYIQVLEENKELQKKVINLLEVRRKKKKDS
jgi:hypothetical protein